MAEWFDAPVGTKVQSEATGAPEASATDTDMVAVVYPNGSAGTVPRSQLEEEIVGKGARLEGEAQTEARERQKAAEGHQVDTGIRSFASTATLGGTDLLAGAISPEYAKETRERREANTAGNIIGGVAGALTPWGAGGLASSAGRAAEAAIAARAGTGLGGRLVAAGARGAAEGGVFGAGMGASEVGLTPGPVSWESAAATIGSNALGGAGVGFGIGVGAKLLEEGAVAAKGFAQRKLEEARAPEAAAVDRSAFPEIATMDKKAAREAIAAERETVRAQRATDLVEGKAEREAEVSALEKAKDAAAAELHSDALDFKNYLRNERAAFIETADAETASVLRRSKVQIMKGLDNAEGFIRKRGTEAVLDGLQKQKGALEKVLADADDVMFNADIERQAVLDRLPQSAEGKASVYLTPDQSQLYADYAGVKMPKGQPGLSVTTDELAGFRGALERGDVNPPGLQRVLNAQELMQRNQALLDSFAAVRAPVASETLTSLDAKLEAARAGVGKTPRLEALEAHLADVSETTIAKKFAQGAGALAGGHAGFALGGPMGAIAGGMAGREVGGALYDRLVRKIQSGNAMRAKSISGSVAQLFATGAERVGRAATKVAPRASRILPAIRYAPPAYVAAVLGPANEQASKSPTVMAFRERARELNALTERRPDGGFAVRMPAREALNARLQALWAIDPDFANGVEKTHNARLEFLASKLPRNPAPPHLQVGPDTFEPSHAEIAKFARYMEAVEQPERIVERMSVGTMTPEDAEVLKACYPGLYDDTRQQVMSHLVEARSLPFQRRLTLSIFLDVNADPAVTPEAITVYQGLYAQPQASAGAGTGPTPGAPPKSFKSSEKPTPGQRAGAA